ncbi:MAG: FAD-dependent oxidoreductase [Erythrobacter sp.]
MTQRALIVGDGIAGLGAAIVLARAGWQVTLTGPHAGKAALHREHAHLTSAAVMAKLERVAGSPLGGWRVAPAAVWDDSGWRDEAARPVIAVGAMRHSLAERADALGVALRRGCAIDPLPGDGGWHWRTKNHAGTADLLVDATGSGHFLGRLAGFAVTLEELAGMDRCWSWTGTNDGPLQPWLIAARGAMQSAVLLRGPDGRLRLTLRQSSSAAPDPRTALDRLLVGAGAQWAARIGSVALDPRPLRHDSPLARRTVVKAHAPLPALIRLGDGLIQTAPRLGQGIAQIAEQLGALADALAAGLAPAEWQCGLDRLAQQRWAGLMFHAGLGRIAA